MYKLASYLVREGPLDKSDAIGWALRLATALEVIHRVGVAHGRISAKAIQILGPRCEAAGFMLDSEDLIDEVTYHSPERLDGGGPTPEDDTWAAGVVLYYSLTGVLPFPGSVPAQVKAEILASHAVSLASRGVKDEKLQRLIDELFASEPEDRVSSLGVLQRRLIECEPSWEGLPPLKIGKPDLASFNPDEPDDDGDQLTALHDVTLAIDSVRSEMAQKRRQSDPVELDPDDFEELDDAETQLDDGKLAPARKSMPPPRPDAAVAPPPIPDLGHDSTPSPPPVDGGGDAGQGDIFGLGAAEGPVATPVPAAASPAMLSRPRAATPVPAATAPAAGVRSELSSMPPVPKSRLPRSWRIAGAAMGIIGIGAVLVLGLGLFDDDRAEPDRARATSSEAPTGSPAQQANSTSEPAPTTGQPVATVTATASASREPTAAPTATGVPVAASTAKPAAGDLPSCMAPLFPAGTFAGIEPKFEFICTETHARKGGTALKVEVVRAGAGPGALPEAMQEWAKLGWYEMAVFAVARARCCSDPPPLATPLGLDLCPLDQSLEQLGKAAVGGDAAAVQMAIDAYTEVAVCLVQAGASKAFGQAIAPTKMATDTFKQIVARAAK